MGIACYLCRNGIGYFIFGALLVAVLGYGCTALHWELASPVLKRPYYKLEVEGRVIENKLLASGQRVVLTDLSVADKWPDFPTKIRVKINGIKNEIRVGDRLKTRVNLQPPPMAVYPGSYDFSVKAWFDGIGAVGYNVAKIGVIRVRMKSFRCGTVLRHGRSVCARQCR